MPDLAVWQWFALLAAFFALVGGLVWVADTIAATVTDVREAKRAKATQPEPEPIPYRCAASSCHAVRRDGEWVCGRCGRSMNLNRSAS